LRKTEEEFGQFGLQKIMLSHCTGVAAYSDFARAFPDRRSRPGAGSRAEFGK